MCFFNKSLYKVSFSCFNVTHSVLNQQYFYLEICCKPNDLALLTLQIQVVWICKWSATCRCETICAGPRQHITCCQPRSWKPKVWNASKVYVKTWQKIARADRIRIGILCTARVINRILTRSELSLFETCIILYRIVYSYIIAVYLVRCGVTMAQIFYCIVAPNY